MQEKSVNIWQEKLKYRPILENIYKKDGIVRPELETKKKKKNVNFKNHGRKKTFRIGRKWGRKNRDKKKTKKWTNEGKLDLE